MPYIRDIANHLNRFESAVAARVPIFPDEPSSPVVEAEYLASKKELLLTIQHTIASAYRRSRCSSES